MDQLLTLLMFLMMFSPLVIDLMIPLADEYKD
jgi:hypothetical protein